MFILSLSSHIMSIWYYICFFYFNIMFLFIFYFRIYLQFNSISQIFYNFSISYHILYIYFGCLVLLLCLCNSTLRAFPPHRLNPVLLLSYTIVTSVPRTATRVLAMTSQILNRCRLIKHDYQEVIPGEQGTNEMLLLFSLSISVLRWKRQQQRDQIVITPPHSHINVTAAPRVDVKC